MSKKLIISIKKDGSIEAHTKGIKGNKCEDFIKLIEELTNSKAVTVEHTSEYYEEDNELYSNEKDTITNL